MSREPVQGLPPAATENRDRVGHMVKAALRDTNTLLSADVT